VSQGLCLHLNREEKRGSTEELPAFSMSQKLTIENSCSCRAGPVRDPEVISKVGNMWFNPKMPGQAPRRPPNGAKRKAAESQAEAPPTSKPRLSTARLALHRRLQKEACALERAVLPDWLPASVALAVRGRAACEPSSQRPAPSASSQATMKQRMRTPFMETLRDKADPHTSTPLTGTPFDRQGIWTSSSDIKISKCSRRCCPFALYKGVLAQSAM
jgi:hypothetical protein